MYSSDSRYSIEYKPPNDWQLQIKYVNERDEGQFECQVNTVPPLALVVLLEVISTSLYHALIITKYSKRKKKFKLHI